MINMIHEQISIVLYQKEDQIKGGVSSSEFLFEIENLKGNFINLSLHDRDNVKEIAEKFCKEQQMENLQEALIYHIEDCMSKRKTSSSSK